MHARLAGELVELDGCWCVGACWRHRYSQAGRWGTRTGPPEAREAGQKGWLDDTTRDHAPAHLSARFLLSRENRSLLLRVCGRWKKRQLMLMWPNHLLATK